MNVTVTTPGGMTPTSSADLYTYMAAPTVNGVSPTQGSTYGGTSVTITGTDLSDATAVEFGPNTATIESDSATQVVVISPVGIAGTTNVEVITPGGESSTSTADQFTYYVPLPVVSAVSPGSGPAYGNETVTITGSGLANATAVDFGTIAATVISDAAGTIVVDTPASSPGTVDVTVVTAGGTSAKSGADQYTFVVDPVVASVSPAAGPLAGNSTVTISGQYLSNATQVMFGTVAGTILNDSATSIIVTTPSESAGTVNVTVTTGFGGTSATSSADLYSYVPAPVVSAISPNAGPTAGGAAVTLTGTNLVDATEVLFGTAAATINSDSATTLVVTSPAGSVGQVSITVVAAGGTSSASSADLYTYVPAPSIQYISVTAGSVAGGTTVALTGTNLSSVTAVDFGSIPAAINSNSGFQIVVTTPAEAAGTVSVTATTPGGTATAPYRFTFIPVPVVDGLSPDAGPLTAGTTVTISGAGLANAAAVDFGTTAATILNDSANSLVVTAPAGSSGTVDVAVTIGGTTSATSSADKYSYEPVPVVDDFGPDAGPLAGGTAVTITGTGLANATVSFGSVPAAIVSDTSTQLVVDSPGGTAGTVNVTVATAGGVASNAPEFTTGTAEPSFADLSSPTIAYGSSATISGTLDSNAGTYTIPVGEDVQVTMDGIAHTAALTSSDTFSTTFSTSSLPASSTPYNIAFSYGGDANYTSATGSSTLSIVQASPTFSDLSSPVITYGVSAEVSGTLTASGVLIPAGEHIQVTLDGVTQTATLSATGTFSTTFSTADLSVSGSPYTLGFSYGGDADFAAATGSSTVSVNQATPTFSNLSAPVITLGTPTTTIGGTLAAGSVPATAGDDVQVSLDGVTETAVVGAEGAFAATFDSALLASSGSPYAVAFGYAGDGNFITASGNSTLTVSGLDAAASTLTAAAGKVASGTGVAVTLQAIDTTGQPLTSGGQTVKFSLTGSGTGTLGTVIDNGNGTYTAILTGGLIGTLTISATIDGQPVETTLPSVTVTPGALDPQNSLVTLTQSTVTAGNTVAVTVQARDAAGNDLTTDQGPVTIDLGALTGGQGTFSPVTDDHNGTYTAVFSAYTAGTNTVVATIGGQSAPPAQVAIVPGAVDLFNSTLTLPVLSLQVGGQETVTLQTEDSFNNDLTTGGLNVVFSVTGPGSVGPATDNGDGTYTAIVKGTGAGQVTVGATIDGGTVDSTLPTVGIEGAALSLAKSKVIVSTPTLTAGTETMVQFEAKTAQGGVEPAGGLAVGFKLSSAKGAQGSFAPAVDMGNGWYEATFSGVTAGANDITVSIEGMNGSPAGAAVKVVAGALDWANSKVTASAPTVKSGGKATVTVQPLDAYGNVVADKYLGVVLSLSGGPGSGTLSKTTYNANGTWAATFTAKTAGAVALEVTAGGSPVPLAVPGITVIPGTASASTSHLTASSYSAEIGVPIAITLQAVDAAGNDETAGGQKIAFVLSGGPGKGTLTSEKDNGDGTYTILFTATKAGSIDITAAIAGVKLKAQPVVIAVA